MSKHRFEPASNFVAQRSGEGATVHICSLLYKISCGVDQLTTQGIVREPDRCSESLPGRENSFQSSVYCQQAALFIFERMKERIFIVILIKLIKIISTFDL